MSGFQEGDFDVKIEGMQEEEIDALLKKYKRLNKYRKSNIFAIKTMDGTEDIIAPLVDDIFTNPIGAESFTIILGAIAFGIQIYGDFSGYSDIAIGAALVLGLKIPINFNKPYFASSPSDFWRRWHISLSTWLKDYLYIPLGGSKGGKWLSIRNIFIIRSPLGKFINKIINFTV